MNIKELYTLITASWDEETKSLKLTADKLESSAVAKLFADFLKDKILQLKECDKPELKDNQVQIANATLDQSFYNLDNCIVNASFYLDKDELVHAELHIFQSIADYKLNTSFDGISAYSPGKLPFKDPEFVLKSDYDPADFSQLSILQKEYLDECFGDQFDEQMKNGMCFNGTVSFAEPFDWIVKFFTGHDLQTSGPVQLLETYPRMILNTDVASMELSPFKLDLSFDMISLFNAVENKEKKYEFFCTPLSRLNGNLIFNKSPVPEIPVSIVIPEVDSSTITIESRLLEVSKYALKEFTALLSGMDPLQFIPADMPVIDDVEIYKVAVDVDIETVKLQCLSVDFKAFAEHNFVIIQDVMELGEMSLNFYVDDPFTDNAVIGAEAYGSLILHTAVIEGSIDSTLSLSSNKDFAFSCKLGEGSYIDISKFIELIVPVSVPVPEIKCDQLEIGGSKEGDRTSFNFYSNISSDLAIDLGLFTAYVKCLDISFAYSGGSVSEESLEMTGLVDLGEKTHINVGAAVSNKGWKFKGSVDFDEEVTLNDILPKELQLPDDIVHIGLKSLSMSLDTTDNTFDIEVQTNTYLQFGDFGKFKSDSLNIHFQKIDSNYEWSVKTRGGIELLEIGTGDDKKPLIDIEGTLTISGKNSSNDFSMIFKTDEEKGYIKDIPILIPYKFENGDVEWSLIEFQLSELALGYSKENSWSFDAEFKIIFSRIIEQLANILPKEGIDVKLHIGKKESYIELKNSLLDIKIPDITLPSIEGGIESLDVGKSRLKLGALKLLIGKSKLEVKASMNYYLPQYLNNIFGEEGGEPKLVIFDTYDPEKEGDSLQVSFNAGYEGKDLKAGISIDKVPISFICEKDNKWEVKFGPESDPTQYGCVLLDKPELSIDVKGGGFKGSFGFEVVENPKIPLDLLKRLLTYGNLKALADNLPDDLELHLLDPPKFIVGEGTNKHINVEGLNEFFDNKLPDVVEKALNEVSKLVSKLPDSFTEYLNPVPVKELHFNMSMKAGGSLEAGLRVDPGIKLMFIQPSPTSFITGVELREFAIGELFSGQLFSLRIDADIDSFDIVNLAASVLTPEEMYDYIGTPTLFRNRLMIHNLLTLIVWQTEIPIPIPLFYDKLGIDYYGIGDIKLESGFEFKEPEFDLQEIGTILKDLIQFCTDPIYRFPVKKWKTDICFNILPSYIQTGKYMGSQEIGLIEGYEPPSFAEIVASMLNGTKFFNIVDFLKSIPLDDRVGSETITTQFIGMTATMDWLFVTPNEFIVDKAYEKLKLDEGQAQEFLTILPNEEGKPITKDDNGLILFLKGIWDTDYSNFDVAFGLIAVDNKRFYTGFSLNGSVTKVFDVSLFSTLEVNPPDTVFDLTGEAKFDMLGLNIYEGKTSVKQEKDCLSLSGLFCLLDDKGPVYAKSTGDITGAISKDKIYVDGGVEARFLVFKASGSVHIEKSDIDLKLKFNKKESSFTMTQDVVKYKGENKNAIVMNGDINLSWSSLKTDVTIIARDEIVVFNMDSQVMADLLHLSAKFDGSFEDSLVGAKGNLDLYVVELINPKPVFSEEFRVDEKGMYYSGRFSLLPESCSMKFKGDVSGRICNDSFTLNGDINLNIGAVTIKGNLNINNKGISGQLKGDVFVYHVEIDSDISASKKEIVLGEANVSMIGLPLFTGKSLIDKDKGKIDISGNFNLLDVGNLIYFKSSTKGSGGIDGSSIQLAGNVNAGILIFAGSGSFSMGVKQTDFKLTFMGLSSALSLVNKKDYAEISGHMPVLFTQFVASIKLFMAKNQLSVKLTSDQMAGLVVMTISFDCAMNAKLAGAVGGFDLCLLKTINPNPVISGKAIVSGTGFNVSGNFKLLPDSSPFNIKGNLSGTINERGYKLSGAVSLSIIDLPALQGTITIDTNGIRGSVSSALGKLEFGVKVYRGILYIFGKYTPVIGKPTEAYIDNVFPFLHLGKCPGSKVETVQSTQLSDLYKNTRDLQLITTEAFTFGYGKRYNQSGKGNETEIFSGEFLDLYLVRAIDLSNNSFTIDVKAINEKENFFTDIKTFIQTKIGYELNIKEINAKLCFNLGDKSKNQTLILTLPHEANKNLQTIQIDFDNVQSKKVFIQIAEAVKQYIN